MDSIFNSLIITSTYSAINDETFWIFDNNMEDYGEKTALTSKTCKKINQWEDRRNEEYFTTARLNKSRFNIISIHIPLLHLPLYYRREHFSPIGIKFGDLSLKLLCYFH